MALFRNKKKGVAPHTWYPEILHWREGDEIVARNANATNIFSLIIAIDQEKLNLKYFYRGVSDSGFIMIEEKDTKELHKVEFSKFIQKATNLTLRRRLINKEIADSRDYMELMDNFQEAFDELQAADNYPKRLGSGAE